MKKIWWRFYDKSTNWERQMIAAVMGAIEAWEIQGLKEIPYRRSAMLYP